MSLESVFKLSLLMNMVDNISGPMAGIASQVGANVESLDRLGQTFGNMAKTGAVMQEMGTQILGAALAPVEATFETRRALGELAAMGVEDFAMLENAARDFSDTWAGTAKSDFLAAAIDIKGGIDSLTEEGVAKYTELSGVTAKATGSAIDEMTSLFATGYGIYKDFYDDLSDIEFAEMFSAGLSQSILTFKASGSSMAQSITALGGSATTANVPLEEQLAILGMLQATMSGSEAGTKYRAFLRTAAEAGDELGISMMDANNQLLSMPEILDNLRAKYGDTLDAIEKQQIQSAFGSDMAVGLLDLLYPKVDALQDNILTLYGSMGQGAGVAEQMASAINDMEPDQYDVLHQRLQNIKESIGNSLLPVVSDMMGHTGKMLEGVGAWIDRNQDLVRVLMIVALALGGVLFGLGTFIVVVGGTGLIITKSIATFKMFRGALLIAKGALSPLIASVWSFTAALLANPITWVVIGIIALIAGLVLLYNKCEWFRNIVDNILGSLREKIGAAFEFVKGIFQGIGNFMGAAMETAKATVSEKLDNMKSAYEAHGGGVKGIVAAYMEGVKGFWTSGFTFLDNLTGGKLTDIKDKFFGGVTAIRDGIGAKIGEVRAKFTEGVEGIKTALSERIQWFFDSGKKIPATLAEGIKAAISAPVNAVKDGLQRIRNMLPFSDAKTGPLSTLTLSGQRTMTTYAQGLTLAQDIPAKAIEQGLGQTKASLDREPPKRVRLRGDGGQSDEDGPEKSQNSSGGKSIVIQKLVIPVDLRKIKDLQQLLAMIKELEDYPVGNDGEEPDWVSSPA